MQKELRKRGFRVTAPAMPSPTHPKKKEWVKTIKKVVKKPDKHTILVGHSLGVIAILRYIETLKPNQIVGGIISVGGRIIPDPKRIYSRSFYKNPINWKKIRQKSGKIIGIYSSNDPFVPLENGRELKKKAGAALIIEKNKGHFARLDKVMRLPSVLREIFKISR